MIPINKNIIVLVILFVVLAGAGYYAYGTWRKANPKPQPMQQGMGMPGMPGQMPPGSQP